ncbi:MAG TPA: response regulator transcription factor [Clostridia bacterium]|nr:response regulator transcription factor [Clostridia bacterium]
MATRPKTPPPRRSAKKRLFLVEDHPVTSEGFAQLINYQPDLEVCGQAGTAAKALTGIEELHPDLAIVDISLAESNGLELIKHLKSRQAGLPVLVLSTHDETLYAQRALRAGARGYVMKQAPTSEVMNAIRVVLNGGIYLSETMRSRVVHEHLHGPATPRGTEVETLSDRELEVFELIGHGHTTRRIASKLRVSVSTVETHRAHIKEKLNLTNAVELVRRAVEWVSRPAE